MQKYGFVYIWFDRKHKRYYVGCHWGDETDGYICSSPWMRQAYKHRPTDFKRKILKTNIKNRADMFLEEQRYFNMIKPEEIKIRYYNLNINNNKHWSIDEEKTKSLKQKISDTAKRNAKDPAYREKYLAGLSNRDTRSSEPEVREKRRQSMIGKNVGKDNSKAVKISAEMRRGVSLSEEHKNKIKETTAFKPLNNMKIKCSYCEFIGNKGNVARYHNEKCKKKMYCS
jgi:hypothetical protein